MFNSISGDLTYVGLDSVYLMNQGIEWDISVSDQTIKALPEIGEALRLFIYLYHREDRMKLYGFFTQEERSLFFDLCSVEKIGPSMAMKILSGLAPEDFIKALDAGDIVTLSHIPGLGKKTAEKIIFKLKGKIVLNDSTPTGADELLNALEAMGFDPKKAREALGWAKKEVIVEGLSKEQAEQQWLQKALLFLSQKNNPA
ncbi:MAG: Holliday junction branch migration protein RuvA [Spirochaetales bacterium]|nr:Holliday junction branch migration protein RuvA [Spirochaetales bacterium]